MVIREAEMVGAAGFEPATSRTPSVRATRLRHAPMVSSDWGESNTVGRLIQFVSSAGSARIKRILYETKRRNDSSSFLSLTKALL
jgi:hypothetical protein